MKKIGLILLLLAVILFGYLALTTWQQSDEYVWLNASPSKRLVLLVEKDLRHLYVQKSLPPEWQNIKLVAYKTNSSNLENLLSKEKPRLKIHGVEAKKNSPDLQAEVEVLEMPDEQNPGFIFQISLFDLKSQNKVFEIGRTYYFSDLEKSSPSQTSIVDQP